MKPTLGLFHGDPWLDLIVPVVLIIAIIFLGLTLFALFVVWLFFTSRPAYYPAAVYFVVAAGITALGLIESQSAASSVLFFTSIMITLPWSLLFGDVLFRILGTKPSDDIFIYAVVAGVIINTALIFGIGSAGRYFINKRLGRAEKQMD